MTAYGYVGLCRAMYGYVGLCMAVYGCVYCVWLCMAMYGCVWLCMAMYGYVGLCMAVYGCVWLWMSVYYYVCPYRPVRINYSGRFMGHTWSTNPGMSRMKNAVQKIYMTKSEFPDFYLCAMSSVCCYLCAFEEILKRVR